MTNREWLNSLSDDDFIVWLLERDLFIEIVDGIAIYKQPFPRFEHFLYDFTNTSLALKEWFKKEREND